MRTEAELQAYNFGVSRLNARGKELQREQSEIQLEQVSFNAKVLEFNGRCAVQLVAPEVADEVARELKRREGE